MKTALLSFLLICTCSQAYGQCTDTIQYPLYTVSASNFNDTVTIALNNYAGDYVVIDQLNPGETYIIASSATSDYLTIRDVYDPAVLLAHGPSPLTYTPGSIDIIALHINLTIPPCGTEQINRTTTIQCTSCPAEPAKVGVNTTEPMATLDVEGEIKLGDSGRTPSSGMIRWNENNNDFEGYNGDKWVSLTKANSSTWGQTSSSNVQEDQMVTADDGTTGDQFGSIVSISGDYAVIGASADKIGSNIWQGSAYIFHRAGSSWSQQAKITASDGAALDFFGSSVSINGDYAVIGAESDDIGSNSGQGSAYIFHRAGSSWSQQAKITAIDGADSDFFGESVSISGDYAIIGANQDDIGSNSNQGSAYVFHRAGSSWSQQAKITAIDGADGDQFGRSVSISGDYAVIGAYRKDIGSNSNQGSAYIFNRTGNSWSQQDKVTAIGGAASDRFGISVSISGDYAVIGAFSDDIGSSTDQGSAYIFHRAGSSWTQQVNITAKDGSAGDQFGRSVSISGDYAIIGAAEEDSGSNFSQGSAYVFRREGSSWFQQVKITANDGASSDFFGTSVSISGDYAVIGADGDNIGTNFDQGSAYFLEQK